MATISPTLNPGDRVRFIGMVLLGVPFGAEGTVRHVDGPDGTLVVDFPAGPFVCWRSELEAVA